MPTPQSSNFLRAALALKLSHIQLATRSYLRDRTKQATGTITGYAVAIGLFGAAGLLLIAACLVGATALFRWIEVSYGRFPAFGAIGALLLLAAAICAVLAIIFIKRAPPAFPSLASRLRVAFRANPVLPGGRQPVPNTASSNIPTDTVRRSRSVPRPGSDGRQVSAGLILVATMLGWAAARRWQQARRATAPDPQR